MAKKSNKKRKSRAKNSIKSRLLLFCVLTVFVGSTLAAGFYFIFLRTKSQEAPPVLSRQKKSPIAAGVPYEEIQEEELAVLPGPATLPPQIVLTSKKPKVAIIIDDMGYRKQSGEQLLALDLPLSFAFLPFAPYSADFAKKAHRLGRDVLLHLPQEAVDPKWNTGPGFLTTRMDARTLKRQLIKNISSVPHVIGINNHMGSRFSINKQSMRHLLLAVKDLNLFYLDSVTVSQSVGYAMAKELHIKTGRRNIFLDNVQEPDKIIRQLDNLVELAKKQGQAIGIGHPYPATVKALLRYQTTLLNQTRVTPVHELLEQ